MFNAKKDKDLLSLLGASGNDMTLKTEGFNLLRHELQDWAAQAGSRYLKELVEAGKAYEKLLKKIEGEWSEKQIEKLEAGFKKLENIKLSYYDLGHIQERKTGSLEMLIKYNTFIPFLYNSLEFKPSSGQIIAI